MQLSNYNSRIKNYEIRGKFIYEKPNSECVKLKRMIFLSVTELDAFLANSGLVSSPGNCEHVRT